MERAEFRRLHGDSQESSLLYSLRGNSAGGALELAKSYQYYNSHGTAHSFGDESTLHRDRESVRSYGGKGKVFTNSSFEDNVQ